jgi:predicted RNase H-like HicB family nuclease
MAQFLIILEKGRRSYGAYAPDIPGCVAVGDTPEETSARMREALIFHLKGMAEDQEPMPVARSIATYIDIDILP